MPDDNTLEIPVPTPGGGGNLPEEEADMPENSAVSLDKDDYAHWKNDLFEARSRSRDGAQVVTEAMRLKFVEGAVGYREALAVRTVGQPGVATHTDTSPK